MNVYFIIKLDEIIIAKSMPNPTIQTATKRPTLPLFRNGDWQTTRLINIDCPHS